MHGNSSIGIGRIFSLLIAASVLGLVLMVIHV